mmetsp:Transcript_13820/g.57754  ORF Transcript_13820/g.57754 Transcript_13820/m.57754 type:complete len:213 (-) Transcript_13820:1578-2216(-)
MTLWHSHPSKRSSFRAACWTTSRWAVATRRQATPPVRARGRKRRWSAQTQTSSCARWAGSTRRWANPVRRSAAASALASELRARSTAPLVVATARVARPQMLATTTPRVSSCSTNPPPLSTAHRSHGSLKRPSGRARRAARPFCLWPTASKPPCVATACCTWKEGRWWRAARRPSSPGPRMGVSPRRCAARTRSAPPCEHERGPLAMYNIIQ